MPVEAKPLFRPDVLRVRLGDFDAPSNLELAKAKLGEWAEIIRTGSIDALNERELLPDFLTDLFVTLLGYEGPPGRGGAYTLSRERHVQVDGQFADACLGRFAVGGSNEFVVVVEGKGPKDPLERPHGGRRMSAVDQGYKYAVNLPCDWVVITNIRQTRPSCRPKKPFA
ncbi:MAG: Eco57I restriction endonuclease [Phycisphaerales bacterium]|nr:Eco57I restriction endonuclease [Phycisphaerales bacterium]